MDMTKGNIRKTLFSFALPMVFSLITQQLYSVVDMIIIGRYLGVNELASVGNAASVVQILITLSGGLEMGSEVIFAKYIGEKKYEDIIIGVKSILLFGFISGLCITVIGMCIKVPILSWINVPTELSADTGTYISIYIVGITGIFLYDISRAIIVALGDSRCSMILVIFTSSLNVVLDLFFIYTLHMGVGGAAFATILSQIIGMIITLAILRKKMQPIMKEYKSSSIQLIKIKEILSISVPTIFQQLILSLSSLFLQTLVNPYGGEVISGYMTVNKIMLFGMLIVIGISQALSIFISSNSGAKQINRIREGYKICMLFSTIYLLCVAASNFLIPQYLIGTFIDIHKNPTAYQFAKIYLQFSCLTYLFYGWKIINESVLRGFLMMKEYLYSNLSDLVVKIAATYVLVSQFSFNGFWVGNMLGKVISLIICILAIRHNNLLQKN
ncbi:MATE family efflux transporter [Clostridium bovifaecis]|uniref:Probable multidrug resistance protein NorM n=1 Tax=Clostridium bovifaecis TaxID=2184719 RepID=A0A6I6F622_9CLOT|nr:MATE family efflux transporter [Clostridium bovifaecis]